MTNTSIASAAAPSASAQGAGQKRTSPINRYLVGQFSRPYGLLGAVAGRIMSKRGSNVDRNLWLVDLLDLDADCRVLEVGPGPGVALEATTAVVSAGTVVGLDHSEVMLRQAARRNRTAIADGRLALVRGEAQALPTLLGRFDRIYSMNVWQFWSDQERVIAGLAAQLSPGGRLAIGFQPRHKGATSADADAAGRCLSDQFAEAGLVDIDRHNLDLQPTPVTAVIGRRPYEAH